MSAILKLLSSEEGTTAVEYAILLSLIITGCIVAITAVGEAAYDTLWDAVEAME